MSSSYILLARHGKGEPYPAIRGNVQPELPLPGKERPLSDNARRKSGGLWETREIAAALRDECASPSGGATLSVGAIWTGTHTCTQETAGIFASAVGCPPLPHEELDPENFRPNDFSGKLKELRDSLVTASKHLRTGNAILVVGHEPMLGGLQSLICGTSLPLRNSELVCIELRRHRFRDGRILWALTPSGDDKTMLELKRKLQSKMATAKLLGAVISALLVFSLAALVEKERFETLEAHQTTEMMKVAAGFLFAGLALYLLSMYAYDSLLMPVRLWTHGKRRKTPGWLVSRPPSSAVHIVYLNMMHIWNWLFTPATCSVVLGLLCLAWASFAPNRLFELPWEEIKQSGVFGLWLYDHAVLAGGGLIAGAVGLLWREGWPVIGSRD